MRICVAAIPEVIREVPQEQLPAAPSPGPAPPKLPGADLLQSVQPQGPDLPGWGLPLWG